MPYVVFNSILETTRTQNLNAWFSKQPSRQMQISVDIKAYLADYSMKALADYSMKAQFAMKSLCDTDICFYIFKSFTTCQWIKERSLSRSASKFQSFQHFSASFLLE